MDMELELGQEVSVVDLVAGQQRTGTIVAISLVALAVAVRLDGDNEPTWLDMCQVSAKN